MHNVIYLCSFSMRYFIHFTIREMCFPLSYRGKRTGTVDLVSRKIKEPEVACVSFELRCDARAHTPCQWQNEHFGKQRSRTNAVHFQRSDSHALSIAGDIVFFASERK